MSDVLLHLTSHLVQSRYRRELFFSAGSKPDWHFHVKGTKTGLAKTFLRLVDQFVMSENVGELRIVNSSGFSDINARIVEISSGNFRLPCGMYTTMKSV